jgi:hypothetical protein
MNSAFTVLFSSMSNNCGFTDPNRSPVNSVNVLFADVFAQMITESWLWYGPSGLASIDPNPVPLVV